MYDKSLFFIHFLLTINFYSLILYKIFLFKIGQKKISHLFFFNVF
jgi:hypothetical protein